MSTRYKAKNSNHESNNRDLLCWDVHPAGAQPLRMVLVTFFLIALLGIIYYLTTSILWVAFSALILLISLRQFFLPTTFKFSEEEVSCRCLWFEKKRPWRQYHSFFIDKNGVLLSPFTGPSRLENFRGFYLIGAHHRPEALEFIREKIGGPAPS